MARRLSRVLVVVAAALAGCVLADALGALALIGVLLGASAGAAAVALEMSLVRVPLQTLAWTAIGAAGGLLTGIMLGIALGPLAGVGESALVTGTALLGAWVGGALGARRAHELPALGGRPRAATERIVDTSVLIDGRIADIVEVGFLDGTLVVPQFVVRELQRLSDSGDAVRRNRGRRGFDVLERLRKNPSVTLALVEDDFPAIAEVDAKLVALARARGARLLTNDAALGRIAALAGAPIGNVNELASALRPVALPGEAMAVQVLREGKEMGQGVAYLDDGTMVVIEGGRRFIGRALDVVVTSVLQTSSGRMIFTRPRDESGRDA